MSRERFGHLRALRSNARGPGRRVARSSSVPRLSSSGVVPLYHRALAGVGLAIAAPVVACGAIAVRLSSSGPALFRQQRIGIGGKPITIVKLRTMHANANATSTATTATDERVTAVGSWLRRFKIDELPQLWCVVKGDMAIIGPRPDVAEVIDALPADQRKRLLDHQPGITGIASLYFRDEAELLDRVDDPDRFSAGPLIRAKAILNDAYATRSTWRDDVRIIALTLRDRRDVLAELVARVAPDYQTSPEFEALFEQAPDFFAFDEGHRVDEGDEKRT